MNPKLIKEYKKYLSFSALANSPIPYIKWWKTLLPEQQFELRMLSSWRRKHK